MKINNNTVTDVTGGATTTPDSSVSPSKKKKKSAIDPETGEEDTDIAALPPGGLKLRINEKEYKMSAFSPNVVMPKEGADEQTAAVTSRGTFSFNF